MIRRTFDPRQPYRVVLYVRMSSDKQNPRSPDQQMDEIKRRIKALGSPWVIVRIYRDDAESGRYKRKRPQFQRMLRDIRVGVLRVDLILSDTAERFGRLEDLQQIRRELYQTYGVLLVLADSNFCDPLSPQGKALGALEEYRGTEDTRIKAHNVLRGKLDAAMGGYWPGGPTPFGLRLRQCFRERNGKTEFAGSKLEPRAGASWIPLLAFQVSHDHGYGQELVTRELNANPNIPQEFKPFNASTVGRWFTNPIYKGVLVFNRLSTDVVDDMRVVERKDPSELIIVRDFCEAIVPPDLWDYVNGLRTRRSERILAGRAAKTEGNDKLIEPLAPGVSVRYLLSGLVVCGECERAMTPSSTGIYTTATGEERRYVRYYCPGYRSRICPNSRTVPEEWLRHVVITRLTERFLLSASMDGVDPTTSS